MITLEERVRRIKEADGDRASASYHDVHARSRPHRHCGTILKVLVLILLGAMLNVAVAWGCAAWHGDLGPNSVSGAQPEMSRAISKDGSHAIGTIRVQLVRGTWYFVGEEDVESIYNFDPPPKPGVPAWVQRRLDEQGTADIHRSWMFELRGWPCRTLWCQFGSAPSGYRGLSDLNDANRAAVTGGIELQQRTRRLFGPQIYKVALPLRPIWPGFAINTLFYAAVLWVLFAGPFALRRMIRRRRGQCQRCAYPIGTNERCTECGAALPPTPTRVQCGSSRPGTNSSSDVRRRSGAATSWATTS